MFDPYLEEAREKGRAINNNSNITDLESLIKSGGISQNDIDDNLGSFINEFL